jgi:hypothetical protein
VGHAFSDQNSPCNITHCRCIQSSRVTHQQSANRVGSKEINTTEHIFLTNCSHSKQMAQLHPAVGQVHNADFEAIRTHTHRETNVSPMGVGLFRIRARPAAPSQTDLLTCHDAHLGTRRFHGHLIASRQSNYVRNACAFLFLLPAQLFLSCTKITQKSRKANRQ